MPVIYIRGVKERDVRRLKVAAAGAGRGLAEYCLKVLLRHAKAVEGGSDPVEAVAKDEKGVGAVAAPSGRAAEVARPRAFVGKGLPTAKEQVRPLSTSEVLRKIRESR